MILVCGKNKKTKKNTCLILLLWVQTSEKLDIFGFKGGGAKRLTFIH